MPGRTTTDAISILRFTMEKHKGKQKGLLLVFIDLEKADDRVPRQEVWRCMRAKGVPKICAAGKRHVQGCENHCLK